MNNNFLRKNKIISIKVVLISFISVFFVIGCKTHQLPECVTKETKDVSIRWGELIKPANRIKGFLLLGDRQFFSYDLPYNEYTQRLSEKKLKALGYVDGKWFCNIAKSVQEAILKTQVSSEPGDTVQYIEFSNPSLNLFYREEWMPRFKTQNSLLMRKVYDSLNTYRFSKE